MPPLWQYLAPLASKADEPIAAPKGSEIADPPDLFPCKRGRFLGATTGATMAIADPSGQHPLPG